MTRDELTMLWEKVTGKIDSETYEKDDIVFFAETNGTKYEVTYTWNATLQDWDEQVSTTPLEIKAGKIYVDHISFDMFTSPYVGAWIQLNAIEAAAYDGTTKTAETSISAAGVISKTASGVTKTYDLPAESGTLATASQVAAKADAPLIVTAPDQYSYRKMTLGDAKALAEAYNSGRECYYQEMSNGSQPLYKLIRVHSNYPFIHLYFLDQTYSTSTNVFDVSFLWFPYDRTRNDDTAKLTGLITKASDNFYTKIDTDALLRAKQDTLVSGTNIKTVNGTSVLGSGNIDTSEVLVVIMTKTANLAYTADKTIEQIANACDDGKTVVALMVDDDEGASVLPLAQLYLDADVVQFSTTRANTVVTLQWAGDGNAFNRVDYVLQPRLVSGTNIKTVNSTSLLGSGNVDIVGKSAYQSYVDTTTDSPVKTEAEWVASLKGADGVDLGEVAIADNLTTDDARKVLSAKQGYVLNEKISDINYVDADEFHVTDSDGNIIATVDADGVHSVNIDETPNVIDDDRIVITDSQDYVIATVDKKGVHAPNISEGVYDDNRLIITDSSGYIVAKVDKDGVHSVKDKHAVACMVIGENYYPTATPIRDGSGNVTHADVMFGTGVAGSIDITYTSGLSSSVSVTYGNNSYTIIISRDADGNVNTVSVN